MSLLRFCKKIFVNTLKQLSYISASISDVLPKGLDILHAAATSLGKIAFNPFVRDTKFEAPVKLKADEVVPNQASFSFWSPTSPLFVQMTADPNLFSGSFYITLKTCFRAFYIFFRDACKRSFGFGFYYLQGLFFILAVDATLTDDEPL